MKKPGQFSSMYIRRREIVVNLHDVSIDLMFMMLITTGLFPLLQYGPFTSLNGDISQHLTCLWMDHLFVLLDWNICCAVNCTDVNINSSSTTCPCDIQLFYYLERNVQDLIEVILSKPLWPRAQSEERWPKPTKIKTSVLDMNLKH